MTMPLSPLVKLLRRKVRQLLGVAREDERNITLVKRANSEENVRNYLHGFYQGWADSSRAVARSLQHLLDQADPQPATRRKKGQRRPGSN